MKITYEQIKVLKPCWSDKDLQAALPLGQEIELTFDSLKGLSRSDTRWLVSRLMTRPMLIVWSRTCAQRAKKYDDAAADAWATTAATVAWATTAAYDAAVAWATAAAWAADAAYDAAYDAADADAEHKITVKHAISLLNGKGIK